MSQRIPPWSVPIRFACCGPVSSSKTAFPGSTLRRWNPIRRLAAGTGISPRTIASTRSMSLAMLPPRLTYQPPERGSRRGETLHGFLIKKGRWLRGAGDTDVLIVGAGPVGLFLANECARRGLRYRIVETHATQSQHSKALAIFPRTLEIFDMAGVAGPFLEKANRATRVAIVAHERGLAHLRFAPEETPYRFIAMVPQDVTEKLLAEELGRRGGAVEYETSFVSAVERDGRVSATLDRKGQRGGAHRRVRGRLRRRAQHRPAPAEPAVRGRRVRSAVHAGRHPDERRPSRRRAAAVPERVRSRAPSFP